MGGIGTSAFDPGREWVDVPPGAILPAGCEIQMDIATGRQQARRVYIEEAARQGNGAGGKMSLLADRDEISRFVGALFRYATEGTYVALHSFYHDARRPPADARKHKLQSTEALINLAAQRATCVANLPEPTVFAPPICTFATASSAAEANLAEGRSNATPSPRTPESCSRACSVGRLSRWRPGGHGSTSRPATSTTSCTCTGGSPNRHVRRPTMSY